MIDTQRDYVTTTVKVQIPKKDAKEWFAGLRFDAQGNIVEIYRLKVPASTNSADGLAQRIADAGLELAKPIPPEVIADPGTHIICPSGLQCHRIFGADMHVCVC